jgi:hypothetical protein
VSARINPRSLPAATEQTRRVIRSGEAEKRISCVMCAAVCFVRQRVAVLIVISNRARARRGLTLHCDCHRTFGFDQQGRNRSSPNDRALICNRLSLSLSLSRNMRLTRTSAVSRTRDRSIRERRDSRRRRTFRTLTRISRIRIYGIHGIRDSSNAATFQLSRYRCRRDAPAPDEDNSRSALYVGGANCFPASE